MARNDEQELKLVAAALNKLQSIERKEAFDPVKPGSKPTKNQQEVIDDFFNSEISNLFCLGGNQSGKTLLALRIFSWLFNGEKKLPNQGDEDPLLVILSRTGKQIEESLLVKLAPCLTPGTYKCIRQGNILQAIHSTVSDARIVFQSFENENVARERVQSYSAHAIMIDEMPRTKALLEEVQRRVNAKRGKLLMSFTPKIVSREVRDVVDAARLPYSKKYFLAMLDNPIYTEADKLRIMSELSAYSESYRNTILNGAWMSDGNLVYRFDPSTMIRAPEGYNTSWRHCECSDPALESSHGLAVAAEDPNTGIWYLVHNEYIEYGYSPSRLLTILADKLKRFNIIRKVADAAPWFINTAREMFGWIYMKPWDKNNRRDDMIAKKQEMLGTKFFIAPWCELFTDEIATYHWSDKGNGKIANADKYHILDAVRYLIDCLPPPEVSYVCKPWQQELKEANRKRLANEAKRREDASSAVNKGGRIARRGIWGRGGRR